MLNNAPRIALIRLSALGDIINSAIVLQLIKKHYPNAHIEWFCEEAFASLLTDHPLLDNVHLIPLKGLKRSLSFKQLKMLIKQLRTSGPFDYIVDMQGLIKSAIVARLISNKVHGFDRHSIREQPASWLYASTSSIPYEANVIRRNITVVADALGFTCSDEEIHNKSTLFPLNTRPDTLKEGGNIALVIGASWPSKQYPKEQVAQLCSRLPYPCHLIWGSHEEHHAAQWIATHTDNAIVTQRMPLKELLNFIAHCDLTIGNDTGPTHMAWAMNRPSITLFGPTTTRMIFETDMTIGIKSPSSVNILKIDRNDDSIGQIAPDFIAKKAKMLL